MTPKILLLAAMAVALLTLQVASTDSYGDRDWVHHTFSLLEISTTDIVTPSPLFYGTAPLQNDVWANFVYNTTGTELLGFDVGLCTLTPNLNNTGALYQICNIVHFFNNGDQLVLNGAVNFVEVDISPAPLAVVGGYGNFKGASGTCTIEGFTTNLNALYVCDFWTPKYSQ